MPCSDIAIVSDAWHPQINGVVRTLDTVRAELEGAGREVTMITPDRFRSVACPTYREIRLSMDAWYKLPRLLDRHHPAHIHIATEGPLGMAARRYCLKRGLRFTTSFHTRFPEYLLRMFGIPQCLTYRFLRRFHGSAAAMLVSTQSMREELQRHGFTNAAPWTRGVDTALFRPLDSREGVLNYPRPIHLYVGRVSKEKNIDAFLSLPLAGTKLVVGDGPQLAELRQKYPQAIFAGSKHGEELMRYYAGSDVFVFPSRTDTFGLVMLEALACGTPVAAYPVTGPKDVIRDPAVGVLDEDLSRAIAKARTLNRAACVRYAEAFSWKRCATMFAESLVLAGQATSRPSTRWSTRSAAAAKP